jgi:hypothetical protein
MKTSAQDREFIHDHMDLFGANKYRVTADGDVHFYGKMPNSDKTGFWLFAQSVQDAITRLTKEMLGRDF